MVTYHVLPVILHRGSVSGKAFTDFSIGEVINTEKMGIDERSQVLFQKCVGHKKCQAPIGWETRLTFLLGWYIIENAKSKIPAFSD